MLSDKFLGADETGEEARKLVGDNVGGEAEEDKKDELAEGDVERDRMGGVVDRAGLGIEGVEEDREGLGGEVEKP